MSHGTTRLEVEFHFEHGRYRHSLCQYDKDGPVLPLVSHEGDHAADWPPSPVVQQVDACASEGTESLVAVGMAGVSHWSLAVDVDPENRAISFDVACRVKSPAEFLGSTYRLDGRANLVNDRLMELQSRTNSPPIALEALIGRVEIDRNLQLVVRPESIDASLPATVRWKYRFLIP